jgi:hypothetical protein
LIEIKFHLSKAVKAMGVFLYSTDKERMNFALHEVREFIKKMNVEEESLA